jgi:hypothetical protein
MSRAAGRESEPLFAVKGLALRRHHALQLVPRPAPDQGRESGPQPLAQVKDCP